MHTANATTGSSMGAPGCGALGLVAARSWDCGGFGRGSAIGATLASSHVTFDNCGMLSAHTSCCWPATRLGQSADSLSNSGTGTAAPCSATRRAARGGSSAELLPARLRFAGNLTQPTSVE
jgi:hypothetical protein